jgi:hypothetical protein
MKREVNPRLSHKRNTIQFLSELSKAVGIEKKFIDMTQDDLLHYLDKCRKPENEDHYTSILVVIIQNLWYYLAFSSGCIILMLMIQKQEVSYLH